MEQMDVPMTVELLLVGLVVLENLLFVLKFVATFMSLQANLVMMETYNQETDVHLIVPLNLVLIAQDKQAFAFQHVETLELLEMKHVMMEMDQEEMDAVICVVEKMDSIVQQLDLLVFLDVEMDLLFEEKNVMTATMQPVMDVLNAKSNQDGCVVVNHPPVPFNQVLVIITYVT